MSIAKQLIGQKPQPKAPVRNEAVERPLSPRELIDAIAENEFLGEEDGVGKPADGGQPETGEVTKHKKDAKGNLVTSGSKETPGQVAKTPKGEGDPVKYGKAD
jgi:hypothetical protein